MREQRWILKIDQAFEQRFWDFDNAGIELGQYFHLRVRDSTGRKVCGGLIAVMGYLLNYLFCLELWMIIVLTLTMFQQDGPARVFNYYILLNIVFVQTAKRFALRKRPG